MAGIRHVRVDLRFRSAWFIEPVVNVVTYTTVSTVCASPLLGSLVDLDVLDDEIAGVETFGVGVGFGIAEKTKEEFGGLDGPACARDTELFACMKNSRQLLKHSTRVVRSRS